MNPALRDDAVYRTRQAWLRTGLGATAVAALAVRSALLGNRNVPALAIAIVGAALLIGVGVLRGRQSRRAIDVSRAEAVLVAVAIGLLGTAGLLLALSGV